MKAGASSMWASCCGLLNEVMGTGAVSGQQPGFGAGAGPFRFAPSAGYSTYPPASSGTSGLVCQACGQPFSVFRRKHVCSDCRKSFCSLCSVPDEHQRRCATCHLLQGTGFQRPQLMGLRVKDLRQYLLLRNVPTDTCREKGDLVDLVLCHRGAHCGVEEEEEDEEEDEEDEDDEDEEEEEPDQGSVRPTALEAPPPFSASQGGELSRSDSSGTGDQAAPRARGSLSDLSSPGDIEHLSARQLKEILARNFVSYSGCCEKWELVERVGRLYQESERNRKSLEDVSNSVTAVVAYPSPVCNGGVLDGLKTQLANQDENLCRICMDAAIDCVLLECGHMVTCTKCGKRMSECPICRQYVVRAVHVFKS